jgi:hypothetical protein
MTALGLNMRAPGTCLLTASLCALLSACGDDGSSSGGGQMYTTRSSVSDGIAAAVDVVATPGQGTSGLAPGTGKGTVIDGWEVEYRKLLITVGDITFAQPDGSDIPATGGYVVDLLMTGASGAHIATLDLPGGVSELAFTMPNAGALAAHDKYASAGDADLMNSGGFSLYVEGSLTKKDGRSCLPEQPDDCVDAPEITFRWGIPAGASYTACKKTGATSGIITVDLAIPAVHWLLNSFETDPASLPLRAQWIADADLDRNGETTLDELTQIEASLLFTPALGYDLTRAPFALDTAYDFLLAQSRAIGQRAWGTCATPTPL